MTPASAWLLAGCVAASTLAALPVQAQSRQVVIYRCTDAAGHVTLQNDVACPAGTHQQKQAMDAPTLTPAYVPRAERMPAIVAQEQAQADADIAQALPPPVPAAERVAPPALFECSTWDQLSYLTEEATPRESCRPLQVVGIDGVSRPGASACEQVVDQCTAVPDDSLCDGWKRRVDEAEFRWKFAGAKDDGSRRLEYEKLAATYANSTCVP
jgi:hypothetical protein